MITTSSLIEINDFAVMSKKKIIFIVIMWAIEVTEKDQSSMV